jgi:hypothetical protein
MLVLQLSSSGTQHLNNADKLASAHRNSRLIEAIPGQRLVMTGSLLTP